jgi:hypothetical protein
LHRRSSVAALITRSVTVAVATLSLCATLSGSAGALAQSVPHGSSHVSSPRNDTETFTNWAGYADQTTAGRKFTRVVGTWVEPKVTCSAAGGRSYASFWVGIDGYSSDSVEQLGTDSDCSGKTPEYYAWWEMYPAGSVNLSASQFRVRPGDSLTASVSVVNSRFTLSLTSSEGWKFETVRQSSADLHQSSAEWIAEAPAVNGSTSALSKFAPIRFSRCEAATNNGSATAIASGNRTEHLLDMVSDGGVKMATSSTLSPTGNDFSVTWQHG